MYRITRKNTKSNAWFVQGAMCACCGSMRDVVIANVVLTSAATLQRSDERARELASACRYAHVVA